MSSPSDSKEIYTCPMHPEVVSDQPGKCPECGMNLEEIQKPPTQAQAESSKGKNQNHSSTVKVNQEITHRVPTPGVGFDSEVYVCPMHPEVTRNTPGDCPKCGMNLEKHEGHGAQAGIEENFRRRFFIALPLTLVVLLLSPKIQEWFGFSIVFPGINIILFLLTSIIVLYAGFPFYQMALGEIKTRAFAMMTLVSLAVLAGYFFSIAATFIFPGESLWWEVSTLVLAFLFGHWMEMRAVRGATGALAELAKLIPPTAHKINPESKMQNSESKTEMVDVKTEKLVKGDLVLVKPGEKVPIDGVVVEGESSINESMLTGESRPVSKKKGSEVVGGSINNDGSLTIEVTKTGEETALSQMMELIIGAQETKPSVQKLADRAASWLTFIAITVGVFTFIFWFFINPQGAVFASTLAISVVVIACPHALGLAIPTVTTITTSLAAKSGILIRDMKAVEIARKLNYVVFDKTGTLTHGKFGVSEIVPFAQTETNDILKFASSVEFHSQHSIAQGVVEEAKRRKNSYVEAEKFRSFPGKGAEGLVEGKKVVVGNKALMVEQGISEKDIEAKAKGVEKLSKTFIFVAVDKELVSLITLEDTIREESKKAIDQLKKIGIKTAMLTGDTKAIAEAVAKKLGIDTVFSQVLPEAKVNKIKELQDKGNIVAMVGDGVNDAASLTQAHVGIAIGAGTDVAIESAEIVLVKDDPRDVARAIKLSQKTNAKMKQNLAWAAGYNVLAIPIAAGVLFPFGILLRPEWSAILMSASSIIVVFNALLLRREKLS